MRAHTQERPHHCNICGRSYSQTGNLNVHLKTVHGVVVEGGRAQTNNEGIRPHRCYICNRLFTTSSNMYQHIRSVHNIAIETSKSARMQGSVFRPPPPSLSSPIPSVSSSSQLDGWAQAQLNELKNLSGSTSSSDTPLPASS